MRFWSIILGTLGTTTLMVAALWCWQNAPRLTVDWSRPEVARQAVRCAAVALGALAQGVLVGCVVRRAYRPSPVDAAAVVLAAGVCAVATVSAVALSLAGR